MLINIRKFSSCDSVIYDGDRVIVITGTGNVWECSNIFDITPTWDYIGPGWEELDSER